MPKTKAVEMPYEYVELVLCRDIFHCTPSELEAEDYDKVMTLLDMYNTEQEVKAAKEQVQADREKAAAAKQRAKARRGRRR